MVVLLVEIYSEGSVWWVRKVRRVLGLPVVGSKNWMDCNIRAFLRLCGYYRYFIPRFSEIARPLLDLTKKSENWHWDEPQFKAFETLKTWLCAAPVLKQPNFEKKFFLQTDALAYSVGAILSQEGDIPTTSTLSKRQKPVLHPIAYYSATFIPAK